MFLAQHRKHTPPVVVGMLLLSSLVLRCASNETDAAVTDQGAAKGSGGAQFFLDPGGSGPIDPIGPIDSGPSYTCRPISVEKDCPPPESTCDDATTLAFLTAAKCVDGHCQWTRRSRTCAGACIGGACASGADASNDHRDAGRQCTAPASTADATAGVANAGDGSGCDIPRSVCLGRTRMLYFVDPRCDNGACRSVAMLNDCSGGWCVDGACQYNFTH